MLNKIFQTTKLVVLAIVLSFSLSYVYAWTAPTVSPPGGNTSAPINTSATLQQKSGALTVAGFAADFVTVGISINANAITAPKFCIGNSCITSWTAMTVSPTPTVSVFIASGEWTSPVGVRYVRVRVVGGGGGGRANDTSINNEGGGGGGGGGYSEEIIKATSLGSNSITITVGAGGPGSPASATPLAGTAGYDSSFGIFLSATGGKGAPAGVANDDGPGGEGGMGSGGDINSGGGGGGSGLYKGGTGGSSALGGGGRAVPGSTTGSNGSVYGGGGGGAGAVASMAGGRGADGVVIIEEFY